MQKLLSAVVALFLLVGVVAAGEITITKYDKEKKEVSAKDGDKEVTLKVSDKTKISMVDKDGKATEGKFEDFEKRLGKLPKGGLKVDATIEKEEITEIKIKGGKK